jgi:hypothetical protein
MMLRPEFATPAKKHKSESHIALALFLSPFANVGAAEQVSNLFIKDLQALQRILEQLDTK